MWYRNFMEGIIKKKMSKQASWNNDEKKRLRITDL